MSLEASRFRLGLFFTLGSVLFVVVMTWLTGWFRSEETHTYVCYFSESVQGLENGSSVRFSGVPVGEVKSIEVAPDGRLIEVVMDIEADFPVRDDIVARLDLIGITGVKVVNLRLVSPGDQTSPYPPFEAPYEVIPVVKSSLETLEVGLERLVEIMAEIDVQQISDRTVELLGNMNRLLDSDSLSVMISSFTRAAERIDTLAIVYADLGRRLDQLAATTGGSFPDIAQDLHILTTELTELTDMLDPLADGLGEMLSESYLMTQQLRTLIERFRDSPAEFLIPERGDERWP